MISAEQVEAIKALPKRAQGAQIDAAIESLIRTGGRTKTDAIREVAQALGAKESTVAVGWYRRHRDPAAPKRERKPAAESNGKPPVETAQSRIRETKSKVRWADFEALINEMVEERVQERLDQARKALA